MVLLATLKNCYALLPFYYNTQTPGFYIYCVKTDVWVINSLLDNLAYLMDGEI